MGDPKRPQDGRGIKWSTLKLKTRTLQNGDKVDTPVTWKAFGNDVTYVGYEVELEKEVTIDGKKVSKIQVWVLQPETVPAETAMYYTGWCHGLTFDDTIYSPAGAAIPAILAAGWEPVDCESTKKGDIIVYYDPDGDVTHTATSNGDGTYTSKRGKEPQKNDDTDAAMSKTYKVPPGKKKCYQKTK